jgi:hypothetical protein
MRYLIIFMLLVGLFVVGRRWSPFTAFGVRGEGPTVTEVRTVADFHAVKSDIGGKVEIRTGSAYGVTVHVQQNLLPLLKTEVNDNGVLRIYFDGSVNMQQEPKIEVTAPAFDALTLAGSGEIRVLNAVQADKLTVTLAGSGDVVVPSVQLSTLEGQITGSGSLQFGGTAQHFEAEILGSGDVLAQNLRVQTLDASIAGSGSVHCAVAERITGSIAGSGDIYYSGDPRTNVKITGSGDVQREEGEVRVEMDSSGVAE